MTYDRMINRLTLLNKKQSVSLSVLPHCSNLLHQLNKREKGKCKLLNEILPLYMKTRLVPFDSNNLANYIELIVDEFNIYMDFLFINKPFHHTTDFESSVLPELLCSIYREIVNSHSTVLEVSAQKDLTIQCVFSISDDDSIRFKKKRVDIAVIRPCHIELNSKSTELPIPLVAIECKTNLDKNMISGIEHSASDLKKTFPECKYYVVAGLSDFDYKKTNYASSGIDEIFVLRNQKRDDIKSKHLPRNPINTKLIYELTTELISTIANAKLETTDLVTRMNSGKLIGRTL